MSKAKKHRSLTAVILVVCLLTTVFSGVVPMLGEAASPVNLISNGTFDNELLPYDAAASYDNFKSVEASGKQDVAGSGYIYLGTAFNNSTADNPAVGLVDGKQGIVQNISIESNKTYKLAFDWARNGNYDESDIKMIIRYSDPSNGGWQTLYEKVFYSSYTWYFKEYVDYFSVDTSEADAINADIQIMFTMYFSGHTGGHNAYLDNISLTESEKEILPADNNYVAPVFSEDFSSFTLPSHATYAANGNAIWYVNGDGYALMDGGAALNGGVSDGNNVLKVGQYFTWVRIFAQVEAGKTYTLSWKWAAGTLGGTTNAFCSTYRYINGISQDTSGGYDVDWGTEEWNDTTHTGSGYGLTDYSRSITASADGWICIGFKYVSGQTSAASYFDDIRLSTEERITQKFSPESTELVSGGDFENGGSVPDAWFAYGRTVASSASVYSGSYAVQLDGYSDGIMQYVTLEKGKTYKLSFAWNADTDASARVMNVSLGDVFNTSVSSSSEGFNKYEYTFVATKSAKVPLKFDRSRLAGATYLDDVSLRTVITNAGGNYISNGDFETQPSADSKSSFISEGKRGWCADSAAWATDKHSSATHSLKLSGTADALGVFAVDPDSVARISFDYFGESGSRASLSVSSDSDGNNVLYTKALSGNGDWQSFSDDFAINDTGVVYIRITAESGTQWFDNAKLLKLYKVSVLSSSHCDATADKIGALSGERVTVTVTRIDGGFELKSGYPKGTVGGEDCTVTKQSDNVYYLTAGEGDVVVSVETAAAVGYELLPDKGFESGSFAEDPTQGWVLGEFGDGSAQGSVSDDAYAGNHSLSLKHQSYNGAYYNGVMLERGSTYRLSFYHYGSVNITDQYSGVYLLSFNGSYSETVQGITVSSDDDWNRYSLEFTSDRDQTVNVRINNHGSSDSSALFDNVSLVKIVPGSTDPEAWIGNYDYSREHAPSTDELLDDGSFESYALTDDATQGWKARNANSSQYVSFSGAPWSVTDGEASIRIGAGALDAVYQAFRVKPATSYKLTFDILADQVGTGIRIASSHYATSYMLNICDLPATHEMKSYTVYFQSEATDTAYIYLDNGCISEASYFDNISITELDDRIPGDLGFRKTAQITADVGETDTTVSWPGVKSKLYHNDALSYSVYCSENPITAENISSLTPVVTKSGTDFRKHKITGLEDETTYYYAVVATDPSGNSAILLSDAHTTLALPTYAVKNNGFETGDLTGWYNLDGKVAMAHKSSFSGKYCLEITGWLTSLYQPVLVEPNAKYVWSFAGADQTGKANFYIFSSNSMSDTAPYYVKQTFDANQAWKIYSGTFETAADQERVILSFKNNFNGLYIYADNVYLKKIANEDLYFVSEPADVMNGPSFIVFEWQPVVSRDDSDNIEYTVYYSESPINDGNIGLLKPYTTLKGADSTFATITGLELDKGYYIAVQAKDSLGNTVTEYSSHPFYAREITLADEEEEPVSDNVQNGLQDKNEPSDSTDNGTTLPVIDAGKNEIGNDESNSDYDFDSNSGEETEEEETVAETETRETTSKIKKAVSEVSYLKVAFAVVCFVAAVGLIVLAVIMLRKRDKKLNVYAIAAFVAAAVLIAVGIWLSTTAFTTVIKTDIKTSTEEVLVDKDDVSSTDSDSKDDGDLSEDNFSSISNGNNFDNSYGNNSDKNNLGKDNFYSFDKDENKSDSPSSLPEAKPSETTGKTYYVSNSGNDANNGLSPENAIKSIERVNALALESGDKVLFKCGDLWRGKRIECAEGVTYSSYGTGAKPSFYGGKYNLASPERWVATQYPNVYTLAENVGIVGTFWFNNDEQYAYMDAPYQRNSEWVSVTPDMLTEDLHFCCDYETGEVFLYSASGNPGSRFDSIEYVPDDRTFALDNGVTIDGLNVKYIDYGISGTDMRNVTICNMTMSHIGGNWATNLSSRAGNAIEFWRNCENILVENNDISQCYDTAITCQFNGSESTTENVVIKNVTLKGNKISDCWWSTEFWLNMPGTGKGEIRNLVITENEFYNAGMGWGDRTAPNFTSWSYHIHCFAYDNYNKVDIKVKNNIFDTSKFGLFCFGWTDYMPSLKGNRYIQKDNGQFGYIYQRPLGYNSSMFEVIKQFDKEAVLKLK